MFTSLWAMLQRVQLSLPSIPGTELSPSDTPAAETAAPLQPLKQEITPLKAKFEALATQYSKLQPGAFLSISTMKLTLILAVIKFFQRLAPSKFQFLSLFSGD